MVERKDIKQIDRYVYEIPTSYRSDMRVPARIYADKELLEASYRDRSMEQLVNTTTLPGVVRFTLAMPDIHQGYGFPIGGVAATLPPEGVISPGGIGYDINCGVRAMASDILMEELAPYMEELIPTLYNRVPSGLGAGGIKISARQLDEILVQGAKWTVQQGYGTKQDLEHTEEGGCMTAADPRQVSQRAKDRGRKQVGSLGSGNHFLEIDEVVEVYDEEVAEAFGLRQGHVAVQIHCGSRGFGHQVCGDYVRSLQKAVRKYNISLPDRELVCAPFDSPEGQAYFGAMACAANFAWANRMAIAHWVRVTFEEVLAGRVKNWELTSVYDVAHNIGKVEEHRVNGRRAKVVVHRKGATRAVGPSFPGLPKDYQEIGQPVLVPGSMGTASYILVGTDEALDLTFGSTCHGAGRVMSRKAAKRQVHGQELRQELEGMGIVIRAGSMPGLAEEAPQAYKDVDRVVEVVHGAGIAYKVARLEPRGVIKG
ncbi:MAG TPA: RNA-splicing ligase RtcB [Chloroflexi bacterium]|nr:RNA-splicing ligase RtcB [Chloroflexota bacterium]